MDMEVSDFARMLDMLGNVYLSVGKSDFNIWKHNVENQFSMKSFYNHLAGTLKG